MDNYTVVVTLQLEAKDHGDATTEVERRLCPGIAVDERCAVVRTIQATRTALAQLRRQAREDR